MAMIKCPECSKDISDEARVCPHCGFKLFNSSSLLGTILAFLGIFIGIGWFLVDRGVSSGYIISFVIALVASYYGYNKRKSPN